ncbi:MAG: anti-sigma factor [Candidatus Eisenbacteria bacterium]|uniref:Anti-sigma factor n=1 Tax=Eiseniibacteriota bacterium TaxID=2212470 RepID=A0A849SIE9_UNCEI|nr:anti-sigma factor [Candidatus Eisenbacteria bacterium]
MTPANRLTCEEIFRRLDDYLDRELSADEMRLVKEHLETCAQCTREHAFDRRMLDDVREKLQRIEAPADLRSRIASAIAKAKLEGPAS